MPTVYLVTSGEYSDYSVDGAFSTEGLAKEFAAKAEGAQIEPWELDERCQDENCSYWSAELDLATDLLLTRNSGTELADPKTRVATVEHADYVCKAHPEGYVYSHSYVSQEHANKLCVEKKQEIQRQGGA